MTPRAAARACLLLGALALEPGSAVGQAVAFGDRVLTFDPATWQAATLLPGQVTLLTCVAPDCRSLAGLLPDLYAVSLDANSGTLRSCSAAQASIPVVESENGPFAQYAATYAGIEFNVVGLISECPRQQPTLFQACGLNEGRLYWLTTSFSGCSPEADLPEARFDEILQGLNRR